MRGSRIPSHLLRLSIGLASVGILTSTAAIAQVPELDGAGPSAADTLYVKRVRDSNEYERLLGRLLYITPEHLTFTDSAGRPRLYERSSVGYVGLSDAAARPRHADVVRGHWSDGTDFLANVIRIVPVIGDSAADALSRLPAGLRWFVSGLLLLGAIGWFLFKAYDLMLVGRETARLNRLKLNLEIAKNRYEALALSRDFPNEHKLLADVEVPLLPPSGEPAETPATAGAAGLTPGTPATPGRAMERLARAVLGKEELALTLEAYVAETTIRLRRSESATSTWYARRRRAMFAKSAVSGFYSLFGLFAPIMLLVGLQTGDSEMMMIGAVYAAFLLLIRYTLRTVARRALLRAAYSSVLAGQRAASRRASVAEVPVITAAA
ncbi:MAG TPA: hypothetical protein VKA84_19960 [Gemmatimonadaceae bacterium]|nr:hypothetical protein [Gemmatimonadaceae bacterium]